MSLTSHKVVGPWKGCRQLPLPRAVPQRGSSFNSRRSEGCFETSSICRASLIVTTYPYPLEARVSDPLFGHLRREIEGIPFSILKERDAVPFTMHSSPDAHGHGGKMMRRTRRAELGPTASSWSRVPSS